MTPGFNDEDRQLLAKSQRLLGTLTSASVKASGPVIAAIAAGEGVDVRPFESREELAGYLHAQNLSASDCLALDRPKQNVIYLT